MTTHYDILRGQVGNGFESRIQERINVGWQPYGSPHFRTDRNPDGINHTTSAVQAMVKFDKPTNATSSQPISNPVGPAGS